MSIEISTIVWIIVAVFAVLIFAFIVMYNSLIRLKNRVDEAWSDIDVQLKRRYDLIPNLIETVKGYAKYEEGTLQKIVEARNSAMKAHDTGNAGEQAKAEGALSSTLKTVFALSENYPDLKANQNFLELQRELSDTENKIQASRRFYNANVRDFNIKIEIFPTNIVATLLSYSRKDFFEIGDEKQRDNINVKF